MKHFFGRRGRFVGGHRKNHSSLAGMELKDTPSINDNGLSECEGALKVMGSRSRDSRKQNVNRISLDAPIDLENEDAAERGSKRASTERRRISLKLENFPEEASDGCDNKGQLVASRRKKKGFKLFKRKSLSRVQLMTDTEMHTTGLY